MNDPDAIWKPGYDGPAPIVRQPRVPAAERVPDRDEHDSTARVDAFDEPPGTPSAVAVRTTRSRGRRVGLVAGIALALAAAGAVVVVSDPLGFRAPSPSAIERPDPSVFGGPSARRLPAGADELWSVELRHEGDHWVDVVRRDLVVAAVAAPSGAPSTTILAFDAPTGLRRWTLDVAGGPGAVRIVGAVDDVLVLEQSGATGPSATGVDVVTGAVRWSADVAPNEGYLGLVGSPFIARLPVSPERAVTLIEATTGREVGTVVSDAAMVGRPSGWSTDGRGTWYVVDDGNLVKYDLRATFGEPSIVAAVADPSAQHLVVDGRVVGLDDAGSVTFRSDTGPPVTVSAEVPTSVRSLTPVSESIFVVAAPGTVSGITVAGDVADVAWSRRDGVIMQDHPTVDGSLIQVATRGGAAIELIDGRSGETFEHLTMVSGVLQALVVAGDGAVVLRPSETGSRLVGVDLDGTERWSIPGATPVLVGDRLVVRSSSTDAGDTTSSQRFRITVHGDLE